MAAITNRSKPNSSIAVEKLRNHIFSGELAAGTDHLESELAATLGMSRTPVREAVLILESQGLLAVRPRKGVRILPLSQTDMAEIYDILIELESLAASNAAQRGLAAKDLSQMLRAIDAMDLALSTNDRESWAEADEKFHAELVRLGGNARAEGIVAMMADQVRRARMVTLYMRPAPHDSNDEHRMVYESILNGDAETARKTHRTHRMNAKQILTELLEKHHLKSL